MSNAPSKLFFSQCNNFTIILKSLIYVQVQLFCMFSNVVGRGPE